MHPPCIFMTCLSNAAPPYCDFPCFTDAPPRNRLGQEGVRRPVRVGLGLGKVLTPLKSVSGLSKTFAGLLQGAEMRRAVPAPQRAPTPASANCC